MTKKLMDSKLSQSALEEVYLFGVRCYSYYLLIDENLYHNFYRMYYILIFSLEWHIIISIFFCEDPPHKNKQGEQGERLGCRGRKFWFITQQEEYSQFQCVTAM